MSNVSNPDGAILAIDPGLRGALALLLPDGHLVVADIPVHEIIRNGKPRDEVDLQALSAMILDCTKHQPQAWVEQVGAMPTDGAVQAFAFGKVYGIILALLAAHKVPVSHVTPPVWKRAMAVPASKDGARARASELLPQHATQWPRKKDDGRAEAALLALYGLKKAA